MHASTPTLSLRITRALAHPPASGQARVFDERGGTIGRAAGNDWVLADPSRVLSAHHATIYFEDGRFRLVDCSTNGVFVNDDAAALGPTRIAALEDGDRLQLGDYEMAVAIATARAPLPVLADPPPARPAIDPLKLLASAGGEAAIAVAPPTSDAAPAWFAAPAPAAGLPASASAVVDPLMLLGGAPAVMHGAGPDAARDDAPALAAWFQPPAAASALPADWLGTGIAVAPRPAPTSPASPCAKPAPAPAACVPEDTLRAALDTLLQAAGLDPERAPRRDARATLVAAGRLLHDAVDALRVLLLARARARQELGLPAAILQASGNNPLAFSPRGTGQAIDTLLFDEGPACLGASEALHATLDDLLAGRDEDLAAARAQAARVLDGLAPATIAKACEVSARSRWRPGAAATPTACWALYEARHAEAVAALQGPVRAAPHLANVPAATQTEEAAHGLE